MRLHRFYVGEELKLKKDFWLRDESLLWQWNKVLRFASGQELVLFDGQTTERLYKISEISKREVHLKMITEISTKLPKRHVYLFWSLLKRDNNEYLIQKCTELGVSNFVPIISERTIKKDFNIERAKKIIIEASEQCGRTNIPAVREPLHILKAIDEYKDKIKLLICHQTASQQVNLKSGKYGLMIGPEGGWSDNEQKLFSNNKLAGLGLSDFVLRAETAAIVASSKLL